MHGSLCRHVSYDELMEPCENGGSVFPKVPNGKEVAAWNPEMEEEEKRKIREFLKKVDKKYYRPDIKERKSLSEEMVNAAEEAGGTIPPLEEE